MYGQGPGIQLFWPSTRADGYRGLGAAVGCRPNEGSAIKSRSQAINQLKAVTTAIAARAPKLLDGYGVGSDAAATLLVAAEENSDRMGSEASFTALCGAGPVEPSLGTTQRRRLSRGGDGQANSALAPHHRPGSPALGHPHPRLHGAAHQRRQSAPEAIRCLKRHPAREIYQPTIPPRPNAVTPTPAG
ncbi:transposase [Streptomyces inhibens]|uniref:transposase n=1 Tax=Streptomyces inhibens TaxID=2293571 RepID=UPI00402AD467